VQKKMAGAAGTASGRTKTSLEMLISEKIAEGHLIV
jgi:hypothetical protein